MAARAISSGMISFGLVSIPIKIYPAASSESISFHMLHAKCGTRIRQQHYCPNCNETVDRTQQVRGYEFSKDQYVQFSDDELKSFEVEVTRIIDLVEFVPLEKVDPIYFEKAYYLGPDKGGEKAYRLLAEAMAQTAKVALAKFTMRGKENLVLIRSVQGGLMLHTLFYANEVRNFGEIEKGETAKIKEGEMELAGRLIEELSKEEFRPENYKDEYREKVLDLVNLKIEGREVRAAATQVQRAQVIDLMEALKQSLEKKVAKEKKVAAVAGGRVSEAPVAETSRQREKPLSLEEFKSSLQSTGLEVGEEEVQRSYEGLSSLRTKNSLSWEAVRKKVKRLGEDLKIATSQPDLLGRKAKKLKAARIPVSTKDWDRY